MDPHTRGYLTAPSPLVDPDRPVDPFVTVDASGVTTASGVRLPVRVTVPVPGVLRVRVGDSPAVPDPSPLLVDGLADTPATVAAIDGGIVISGDGVEVTWTAAGLRVGGMPALDRLRPGLLPGGFLHVAPLGPHSRVYGGGEAFQGPDLRGRIRRGVNVETHGASGFDLSYLTVPFFWTDDGWGVFVHTGAPVTADIGATHGETLAVEIPGRSLDLFLLTGSPVELLQRYLALTGLPGRFPEWALGVWTSRCSYLSAAEVDDIVAGYEAAGCPLDVVHVDAWVQGNVIKDLTCSWEIDRERWPEGWASRLAGRGIRTSLWHNPYVLPGTPAGDELLAAGLVLQDADGTVVGTNDMPERMVIDLTDPKAVEWWAGRVTATARSEGVVAFKPDFAEEVPPTAVTSDGRTGWDVRNEYAVRYQRTTHAALAEALGTDEVALFCRSGTAGAQRYPCHWIGDTPATWAGLVTAVRAMLSLSLSGFGLVASDIGGFWAEGAFAHTAAAFEQMDPANYTADVEPELFARWTQLGALSPVMRFHGTGRREPWAYPEPYSEVAIAACRLRERLRTYLKAAADEAATTGVPMMRPMVLAFPGDPAAQSADLQYLLGPDLLVAPVLRPGGRTRVYVPAGRWEPVLGLAPVEGPAWLDLDVPLDAYPVWRHA